MDMDNIEILIKEYLNQFDINYDFKIIEMYDFLIFSVETNGVIFELRKLSINNKELVTIRLNSSVICHKRIRGDKHIIEMLDVFCVAIELDKKISKYTKRIQ